MPTNFTQEFNEWISQKLEDAQVNSDIEDAMAFYNSLLGENNSFEEEIKKTVSKLDEIHRMTDLKNKVERFVNLSKDFSENFDKFLKQNALPNVNTRLQKTIEFFDNLLKDKDVPFKKEIMEMKVKCEEALSPDKSLEDKQKVLHEVSIAIPFKRQVQENEEHTNARLTHYIKRLDIILKKQNVKYAKDLNELRHRFEESLTNDSHQQKEEFLEYYPHSLKEAVSDYLQDELDKQYLNEDILIEMWYMEELLPYLDNDLAKEISQIIVEYGVALQKDDFDEKLDKFTGTVDNYSQKLITYLDTEPEPLPVVNIHLKFFQQYIVYLLQDDQSSHAKVYEAELRALLPQVEKAIASENFKEKMQIIDAFDEVNTQFGQFLLNHIVDFEIYRFGFKS
uniref:Uncharacterized protein n=1 Tax=Glossina brevipalpis TaxID=37001 RepID=A0A1A9W6U8_9MUSC